MNKPQYLAELRRLLVFMTRADRETTVSRCGELFDQAGPDNADELIARIGSPTRISIRLSRGYEPGQLDLSPLDIAPIVPEPEEPEPEPQPESPPDPTAPDMVEGLPELDVPPLVMDDLSGFEMVPQPEPEPEEVPEPDDGTVPPSGAPEEAPGQEPAENAPPAPPEAAPETAPPTEPPAADAGPRFISMPLDQEDGESVEAAADVIIERAVPLWIGIPLFIISLAALALPIGAVCLILLPILIVPGLVLLLCTWLAAVGGLWCTSYIADALMLFGLAFLILSLALVVLWCGLRLDVAIVSGFVRGCRGVAHLTLGKKVDLNA